MKTINTKQIRADLVGFLRQLEDGEPVTVLYRSQPLVTIAAKPKREYESPDAGTPEAMRRSVEFIRSLPKRKSQLDPNKSIKELYDETMVLKDY